MIRLVTCVGVLCTLVNSQVLSQNTVTPVTRPATSFLTPYAPIQNPHLASYNYPNNYPSRPAVPIVSYSNNRGIDGSYSYSYSSADGKQTQERGFLKDVYVDMAGNPQGTQVAEGSFAYISPEGTPIEVSYVADEYGFRTSGVHIPADGKGIVLTEPTGINDNKYNYGNRYNNYGYYNNIRPHDHRYQYYPSKYPLNNVYPPFVYKAKEGYE